MIQQHQGEIIILKFGPQVIQVPLVILATVFKQAIMGTCNARKYICIIFIVQHCFSYIHLLFTIHKSTISIHCPLPFYRLPLVKDISGFSPQDSDQPFATTTGVTGVWNDSGSGSPDNYVLWTFSCPGGKDSILYIAILLNYYNKYNKQKNPFHLITLIPVMQRWLIDLHKLYIFYFAINIKDLFLYVMS